MWKTITWTLGLLTIKQWDKINDKINNSSFKHKQ